MCPLGLLVGDRHSCPPGNLQYHWRIPPKAPHDVTKTELSACTKYAEPSACMLQKVSTASYRKYPLEMQHSRRLVGVIPWTLFSSR